MPFINWAEVREEQVADGIVRQMVTAEKMMFVRWRFGSGLHVPAHRHPNEQIAYMLKGVMELRIDRERRRLVPGQVCWIPGNVEHEAWFPEEAEVVDIFSPPRQDFLTGQDDYLRRG
jgi:quercetin dioxygenase-like cupin family protein